jgi:hypothetical protein
MRRQEASVCLLLLSALDETDRRIFEYHAIHEMSVRQIANELGNVGKSWVRNRLEEIDVALQREMVRFERGGLCESHLEAGGEMARLHIETCSHCRAGIERRRRSARDVAVFFPGFLVLPAPESAGHFLADLVARAEASVSQIASAVTQRVQEASVATKTGAAVVASAVAVGAPVAVTTIDKGSATPERKKTVQQAPTPATTPTLYDPLPEAAPDLPRGDSEAKPEREKEAEQTPESDVPSLAPEGGAQTLSESPAPAGGSGGGNSGAGGGTGDLAP